MIKTHSKQLCWDCKKACGGCSWSKEFVPVKGWDAKPTVIRCRYWDDEIVFTDSYDIFECPEFEHDDIQQEDKRVHKLALKKKHTINCIFRKQGNKKNLI